MQSQEGKLIHVRPWPDAVLDIRGFQPTSPYVELCWLPILGPSATWMARRLMTGLLRHPEGYPVDLHELAAALGLGTGLGHSSPVVRTLRRLVVFRLARLDGSDVVAVRRRIPPLVRPQVNRLSVALQRAHNQFLAAEGPLEAAS